MAVKVVTVGNETQVNVTTTSDQMYPAISGLADGGWIVTWQSLTHDGSGQGIFQRRYDAQGVTTGSDILVNVTTSNDQTFPSVTGLSNGGWVVTWQSNLQDGSKYGVYQRVYNAQGVASGPDVLVNVTTAEDQQNPSVTALKDGGWVVSWQSNLQDGSNNGIYLRRYTSSGASSGADIPVNVTTANEQINPSIVALADGGWVVTWQSNLQDGSNHGIFQRRYNAQGAVTGPDILVNATTNLSQTSPSVTSLSNGGWVVTWQSNLQDGSGFGVYQRVYNAQGVTAGADILVNVTTASDQQNPSVTALKDGGWVVTWQSNLQDGSGNGIYQRYYTASGSTVGPDIQVNTATGSDQTFPSITALANGGWVVSWMSQLQDGSGWGVYQRQYTPNGGQILTGGIEIATGTSENETLLVQPGSLNAGDQLVGGAGTDTLEMTSSGSIDLSAPALLSGFEVIAGTAGNDTFIVNAARFAAFTSFDGRAGADALQFMGSGSFDLRGKTLNGIEKIVLTGGGAAVTVSDPATALLLRGSAEDHNSVTLIGGTFTSVERQQLFRQGMETITDSNGTYSNQPPSLGGLDGDSVTVGDGETILIDKDGNATVTDSAGSLRFLEVLISRNGVAAEDRFGISTTGDVALSSGMASGSLVSVNSIHIGTITVTGHTLQVAFNDNATAGLIQQLIRSLTYTNINEIDPSTAPRTISITLTDSTGAWTTATAAVTVTRENDLPTVAGLAGEAQAVADDGLIAPFAAAVLADVDSTSLTLTVTFDPAKGSLLPPGSGSYDAATGTYTLTGSAAEVTAALNALRFDPRDRFEVGSRETTVFTVRVDDGAGSFVAETSVVATATNRAPTAISLSSTSIDEHAGAGAVIGTLAAADPNGSQGLSFALLDDAQGRFALEDGQLVVASPALLEADRTKGYQVQIKVTDAHGASHTETFTITVNAQNNAPLLAGLPNDVATIADTGTLYPFPGLSIGDADSPSVTVTITIDDKAKGMLDNLGQGHYDPATGVYKVTGSVAEVTASVRGLRFDPRDRSDAAGSPERTTFTVHVEDGSGAGATGTLSVDSLTSNYAPTGITLSGAVVKELASSGFFIGTLGVIDPNRPESAAYTLLDDAGGRFAIEDGRLIVRNGLALDFEQATEHRITVRATDRGSQSVTQSFTIKVEDVAGESVTGSVGSDVFVGGAGRDRLNGGSGNDVLSGGTGQDIFVFDTKLGTSSTDRKVNFDTITDFNVRDDGFHLDNAIFRKLGSEARPKQLSKSFFTIGDKAKDKNDYIVYNLKTGVLSYDADGSGKGKAVEFAQIAKNLRSISEKDFFVI